MEISEIKQIIVKEESVAEYEESENRVFLLGENRWEDPSRLSRHKKKVGATTKCLSCRGEGRLLCTGTLSSFYLPYLYWFSSCHTYIKLYFLVVVSPFLFLLIFVRIIKCINLFTGNFFIHSV